MGTSNKQKTSLCKWFLEDVQNFSKSKNSKMSHPRSVSALFCFVFFVFLGEFVLFVFFVSAAQIGLEGMFLEIRPRFFLPWIICSPHGNPERGSPLL